MDLTKKKIASREHRDGTQQGGSNERPRDTTRVQCRYRCCSHLAGLGSRPAFAQGQSSVKIGLIMPYSGQFADTGVQIEIEIKLYMKQHGGTVAGKKIELLRKDVGGINPPAAKRLAQELVTRDNVDILAGFSLTPNALAAADISRDAKKFMVVMNAATSIITTKSPYMARVSLTLPQNCEVLGRWAFKNGAKKVYTMVSNYGPGLDAEASFQRGLKEAARLSGRCACRSPIQISRLSSSAPRI